MRITVVLLVALFIPAYAYATDFDQLLYTAPSSVTTDQSRNTIVRFAENGSSEFPASPILEQKLCMSENDAVQCGTGKCRDGFKCCAIGVARYCCPVNSECSETNPQCEDTK